MVDSLNITTYLCSRTLEREIYYESLSSQQNAVDYDSDTNVVTAKIGEISLPAGCYPPRDAKVVAVLKPDPQLEGCSPGCGYLENEPEEMIDWGWDEGLTYPIIDVKNPDHCQWWRSYLNGKYGTNTTVLIIITVDAPGEIPIPNDKAVVHSGGNWTPLDILQNIVSPGMLVQLETYFSNGLVNTLLIPDEDWWCAHCITAGVITSIIGTYPDRDIEYYVDVQGVEVRCGVTDFVQWEVGDWVHLVPLNPGGACIDINVDMQDRLPTRGNCNVPGAMTHTILPMKIANFGD